MHKISYTGDGSTAEYAFSFPFFQIGDIHVAQDEQILGEDQYSVNANEEWDGGTVVLLVPPAVGVKVDVFRQIMLSRTIDYQPTAKIDPENLNSDFNFLMEAFRDLKAVDVDLIEWANTHDNIKTFLDYTVDLIEDKLSGGSVLGLYTNLLSVLDGALPKLINDYGSVAEPASNENRDDYGIL